MALLGENVQKFMWTVYNLQTFPLFCVYLNMILLAGVWQRMSSPLQIRPILVIHNFACCILSIYCMFGFLYGLLESGSMFQKGPMENLRPYFGMYFVTKIIELLDTVFMIVRHRRRQISFLHVYHHSSMLLLSDTAYNMYPWPCIAPYLALNSFVHVCLYLYYGLTALHPEKSFPWKKNLTRLQIVQFLIGLVHATMGYFYYGFCIYGIFYGISMTLLFSNFYQRSYKRPITSDKAHSS